MNYFILHKEAYMMKYQTYMYKTGSNIPKMVPYTP